MEKTRILLVEDNPGDVRLIQEDFSSSRYELTVADRLSSALHHLEKEKTDIVLADLSLPDSDFTHTIRTLNAHSPDVAIIVLTGLSDKKLALEALQFGAQDFLVKGHVEPAALEQRILYAIERKRAEEGQSKQRLEIVKQVIFSAKLDIQKSDPKNIFFRCVEDCTEGIMILDNRKRLIYVNPAWEKIYGYTSEEITGKTLHFLLTDEYEDPGESNQLWKGEVIHKAKDGHRIPVLFTIAPSLSVDGSVVGFMAISLDMTTQRQLENQMVRQENLVSIGILASGLAHEIGTPLGIIRGHAEFLQPLSKGNTQVIEGLEIIVSQIDRISKLVTSLLKLSRGGSTQELKPVSPAIIIEEVASLMSGNFNKFGIKLSLEIPEKIELVSDPAQLQQILINILINSVHAIEEAIKRGRKGPHKIGISAKDLGEKIRIDITDTGCGVPEQVLKKLFQPFFTTKDIGKGTGLGLAIVYNLVQEMGGEVNVDSVVDSHTTFSITLKSSRARLRFN